jgi:hypothetical protein
MSSVENDGNFKLFGQLSLVGMKHKFLFYLFTPVVEEHKADMLVLA